jgi:hypothetical protein
MSIFRRLLSKAAQAVATNMIEPIKSTEGAIDGCPYRKTLLMLGKLEVYQVELNLPSSIDGVIQIIPVGAHAALWNNAKKLESIEFNEKIQVFTSSRSLAFKVLSPDFMAWLMDLSVMPQLYIIESKCYVAFFGNDVSHNQQLVIVEKILQALRHSGALVKTS